VRLATVARANGETAAAVERDGLFRALPAPSVDALLREERDAIIGEERNALVDVDRLLQPLLRPGKIICVGLNYRSHIIEMGRSLPEFPTLFVKYADTLIGPSADIVLPSISDRVDWEGELAVVVGRHLHRADEETSAAAIAGYTVANDISLRDWQNRTTQWQQGKMFDATTPLGPVLVTPDEFDPRDGARIRTTVNGVLMQDASVSDLVFDSAHLLSYISQITRLRPGDVVLTGTPGGVGAGRTPEAYLSNGDVVEVSIDGIGHVRNRLITTPIDTKEYGNGAR